MLYAIKQGSFLCFALIHNVTSWVEGFQGKTSTLRGPERLCQSSPRNGKRARLVAFDKIRNVFFINVCSDDSSTGKAVVYLLPSSVFHENWP